MVNSLHKCCNGVAEVFTYVTKVDVNYNYCMLLRTSSFYITRVPHSYIKTYNAADTKRVSCKFPMGYCYMIIRVIDFKAIGTSEIECQGKSY